MSKQKDVNCRVRTCAGNPKGFQVPRLNHSAKLTIHAFTPLPDTHQVSESLGPEGREVRVAVKLAVTLHIAALLLDYKHLLLFHLFKLRHQFHFSGSDHDLLDIGLRVGLPIDVLLVAINAEVDRFLSDFLLVDVHGLFALCQS